MGIKSGHSTSLQRKVSKGIAPGAHRYCADEISSSKLFFGTLNYMQMLRRLHLTVMCVLP